MLPFEAVVVIPKLPAADKFVDEPVVVTDPTVKSSVVFLYVMP